MSKKANMKLSLALPALIAIAGVSLLGWSLLTDAVWSHYAQKASQKAQNDVQVAYNNAVVAQAYEYAMSYKLIPSIFFLENTPQIAVSFDPADFTRDHIDRIDKYIWDDKYETSWTNEGKKPGPWPWLEDGATLETRNQIRAMLTEGETDGRITLDAVFYNARRLSRIQDMLPPKMREYIFDYEFAYPDWTVPRQNK